MGPNENQYAILDEDKTALALYFLQGLASQKASENKGAVENEPVTNAKVAPERGPLQFLFETEVDRIFSSPLGELCNI